MDSATKTLDQSETRFIGLLNNFMNNKEVEKDDVMATFRRLTKARTTYENRLTKKRMELEILAKEFKEVEMLLDQRCLEAITKEEDAKKLAAAEGLKGIDVRKFVGPSVAERNERFRQFCKDRVRSVKDGYTSLAGEYIHLKEIYKIYKRWSDEVGESRMLMKDFSSYCEEYFGDSNSLNIYHHLRVFEDRECVEQFEKEHENIFDDENTS